MLKIRIRRTLEFSNFIKLSLLFFFQFKKFKYIKKFVIEELTWFELADQLINYKFAMIDMNAN